MTNKIIKTIRVTTLVLASFLLVQCNDIETPPTKETFSNVQAYLSEHNPKAEVQQFDAAVGTSFTTPKGTKVTIPANAFMTKSGNLATGQVEFRLREVYSTMDIISSGVFPVSYGYVLNSGGEFYAGATAGGEELIVADGQFMQIEIPAQAEDPNMAIFLARGDEEPDSMINWEQQIEDTIGQGGGNFNGSFSFKSADNSYEIQTDSTGWGNIDAFDWTISYFDITFNLTGLADLNNSNTTAYAVFKDQNSVWPTGVSNWGDITNSVITETHLGSVPMNIIVISVVDDQLYYGHLDVTPVDGTDYDIEMKPTTSDELDALIASFP